MILLCIKPQSFVFVVYSYYLFFWMEVDISVHTTQTHKLTQSTFLSSSGIHYLLWGLLFFVLVVDFSAKTCFLYLSFKLVHPPPTLSYILESWPMESRIDFLLKGNFMFQIVFVYCYLIQGTMLGTSFTLYSPAITTTLRKLKFGDLKSLPLSG